MVKKHLFLILAALLLEGCVLANRVARMAEPEILSTPEIEKLIVNDNNKPDALIISYCGSNKNKFFTRLDFSTKNGRLFVANAEDLASSRALFKSINFAQQF